MCEGVDDPASLVMVLHPPPHGTLLDQAPALDDDLNIEMRGGVVQMASVGSHAVRQVIEEVQPLLTLHGHVHESAAEQKLGRTLCINPGSEYTTGILRGALIGLDPDGIATHQMISG
jgi:Icc-related predicted phosphoesterase